MDCTFLFDRSARFNRNLTNRRDRRPSLVWQFASCNTCTVAPVDESLDSETGDAVLRRPALSPATRSPRLITNVVFMGMGEPLPPINRKSSLQRDLMDDHGFDISRRRVTVSTSGGGVAMEGERVERGRWKEDPIAARWR